MLPSPFALRRAGPSDAAAVDALVQAAYGKWVPVLGRKPMPMTADYAKAVVEHRIDVAEIDGGLAALVELELQPDHLLIVNVAVSPQHQKHGLGRALLAHAEAVARAAGLGELRLYTNALMAENIALYRRHGYVVTSEQGSGHGTTRVNMSKFL